MSEIKISVVIIAHNRKKYLLDAVNSVLKQSLDKSYYEIIVLKNFKDPEIDEFLNKNDVINVLRNDDRWGIWVTDAMKISKGEIISFLDDDDMFEQNKLKIILDIFSENRNLGYIHNDRIYIDEHSNIIKRRSQNFHFLKESNEKYFEFKDKNNFNCLMMEKFYDNLSSTSIRKKILLENTDFVNMIEMGTDISIFSMALSSEYSVLYILKKLTYFRIHESTSQSVNENFVNFVNKELDYLKKDFYKIYDPILSFIKDKQNFRKCFLYKKIEKKIEIYLFGEEFFEPNARELIFYLKILIVNSIKLLFAKNVNKKEIFKYASWKSFKALLILFLKRKSIRIYITILKKILKERIK
ncbi:MAG: glycosyltransferase family 2 protein [Thermoplasmata archaeon]|jgi:glycosyltransferase involved in cell wall biosynthesis